MVLALFIGHYHSGTLLNFLCYSIFFLALLIFLGFGLSLLCCPYSLRPYLIPMSPLMGYCYVTLIGWYCFTLNLGGTDSYAVYIVLPPLVFLYLGIRKYKQHGIPLIDLNEWVIPIIVGCLAFLVLSIPLFDNPHGLTTISLSNNDIADSATKLLF